MKPRALGRIAFAIALFASNVALAQPADPPRAVDEARPHYERGIELFNAGEYPLALIELQRAYAIAPIYRLLYFVGQAQIRVGALAAALGSLETYLSEGGEAIAPERREEVARDIASLKSRTAHVTITCTVDGAIVSINGKNVGNCPIRGLRTEAGAARITATRSGFTDAARSIDLAGGDDASVALVLEPVPNIVQTVVEAPPATAKPSNNTPIIVGWSVAGVAVVGAAISGALAIAAANQVEDRRTSPIAGSPEQAQSDLEHDRKVARGWMLATDIFAVTAILATGVSLYLTLRHPDRATAKVGGLDLRWKF